MRGRAATSCSGEMRALIVVAALAAGATPAAAEPCAARLADWQVRQGDLQPGLACGSYVGASSDATIAYSFGQLVWRRPVAVPLQLDVTWRRLGSDTRSLELELLGAVLLFGDDRVGLWIDDPSFAADGWHPLPGYRVRDLHAVRAIQTASEVIAFVDGREVGRWRFAAAGRSGTVGLGWKGQRGARERVWFHGFAVTTPGHSPATSGPRPR